MHTAIGWIMFVLAVISGLLLLGLLVVFAITQWAERRKQQLRPQGIRARTIGAVRISFDGEQSPLRCAVETGFLVSENESRKAGDLKPGDVLHNRKKVIAVREDGETQVWEHA